MVIETRKHRRSIALAPILLVTLAFYAWTGTTETINPFVSGNDAKRTDAYNLLTNAFLRGHLHLLERVPAGFLALKNPYDPTQSGPWSGAYHDLAYYKGHLFLSWGPTPVVTLLMPWRLLHVGNLPINIGVVIYCWVGLVASVALLCVLIDRYLPATKTWQLCLAATALACCNIAPFLLRRPDTYELAVSSAYCFSMLGLYLLASGGLAVPRRRWKVAAGSLSIGLAIGGRPDLIFESLIVVALFVYIVRSDGLRGRTQLLRSASVVIGPCAIALMLLAMYNALRFGSPLQNGAGYALGGVDITKVPMYQFRTMAPNLYYYLVAPARLTYAFPYVSLAPPPYYPWRVPSFYYGELTSGLLATSPIVFAVVPAVLVAARRGLRELKLILLALVFVGIMTLLFLSVVLPGTTMRYETDYASFFVIAGLVGWFILTAGRGRRVIAALGVPVIAFGCFIGFAISFSGYYDGLRTTHPDLYWSLDRISSPLPTAITMVLGHPVIARVFAAGAISVGNGNTFEAGATGFWLSSTTIEVDIVSPRDGDFQFAPTFVRGPDAGPGPISILVKYDDGRMRRVPVLLSTRGIPLRLQRGLNRIELSAWKGTHGQSIARLVTVNGLRLARV